MLFKLVFCTNLIFLFKCMSAECQYVIPTLDTTTIATTTPTTYSTYSTTTSVIIPTPPTVLTTNPTVSTPYTTLPTTTTPIYGCYPAYCYNNGQCIEKLNNERECICNPNWVGSRCNIYDPCNNKPCGANGACFPVVYFETVNGVTTQNERANFHCQCYSGFSGQQCERVGAQPCASNPCLNNGICINQNNTWNYYCVCTGFYTGKNCGTYVDLCLNNKCQNDALCIPSIDNNNYTCSCKNGFYGDFCQLEINECMIQVNGVLTSPCQNNGTCHDLIDNYFCQCNGPYIGTNCETYVNPCGSNPCGPGAICIPKSVGYTCQCSPGYFGTPCQYDPCASNPCRLPTSTCIAIEAASVPYFFPGCDCTTTTPKYVCACDSTNPTYASANC